MVPLFWKSDKNGRDIVKNMILAYLRKKTSDVGYTVRHYYALYYTHAENFTEFNDAFIF